MAVVKACEKLKNNIIARAAEMLNCPVESLEFDGKTVSGEKGSVTLADIATSSMCGNNIPMEVSESNSAPTSPPPFMVGMVEIELDKETGAIELLDYVAVVDCGTPVNPNLARVQTEGGLGQGIGMTLYEDIQYNSKGKL